jgi:hypothetical protein
MVGGVTNFEDRLERFELGLKRKFSRKSRDRGEAIFTQGIQYGTRCLASTLTWPEGLGLRGGSWPRRRVLAKEEGLGLRGGS